MQILLKPLDALKPHDISELCRDQVSEGTELELKSDLPSKAGPMKDPWYSGGSVGEYARNQIAEEVIAFANTLGGVVCIGINETNDHPKRADSPNPVPRVHDLARRLRQAIYDIIDPPLTLLEASGVVLDDASGSGVVVIRVPQSRRRPHRHAVSKEVYVRRADESAKISMREIQELTLQSAADAKRIDAAIDSRRSRFLELANEWHFTRRDTGTGRRWGGGLHILGVPTTPIDLVRVVGRPALTDLGAEVLVSLSRGGIAPCAWPFARSLDFRPSLRTITAERRSNGGSTGQSDRLIRYSLQTDGTCEMVFLLHLEPQHPAIFATWMAGALGLMLAWIEKIRTEAGVSAEYAVAVQLPLFDQPVYYVEYGANSIAESMEVKLPDGDHVFPVMSVGSPDEFSTHLGRFDEDLWNLAGQDVQRNRPTFTVRR